MAGGMKGCEPDKPGQAAFSETKACTAEVGVSKKESRVRRSIRKKICAVHRAIHKNVENGAVFFDKIAQKMYGMVKCTQKESRRGQKCGKKRLIRPEARKKMRRKGGERRKKSEKKAGTFQCPLIFQEYVLLFSVLFLKFSARAASM